ncbi:hypothetical protein ACHHYP_09442 [Achlya hypogyna]|uniref:Uncharacterized protein n=1 Tax=Achlya hypogyna TaxID=1202772 RepID=A0A1V9ZJ30_ACHHY|nr:hypothetical protein ACHHYP_09442 [Achlya hypogyna]
MKREDNDKENQVPCKQEACADAAVAGAGQAANLRSPLQALPIDKSTVNRRATARENLRKRVRSHLIAGSASTDTVATNVPLRRTELSVSSAQDLSSVPSRKRHTTDTQKEHRYVSIFDMTFADHDECVATLDSLVAANGIAATSIGKQFNSGTHVATRYQCMVYDELRSEISWQHCPWSIDVVLNKATQQWRIQRGPAGHNHPIRSTQPQPPTLHSFYESMPRGPFATPLVGEISLDDWCGARGFGVEYSPIGSSEGNFNFSCKGAMCPWSVRLHLSASDGHWRLYPISLGHNHAVSMPLAPYATPSDALRAVLAWCAAQRIASSTTRLFQDASGRSVSAVFCAASTTCPFQVRIVPHALGSWRLHVVANYHNHSCAPFPSLQ